MGNRVDSLLAGINAGAVFISSLANVFYYSGFKSDDAFLLITGTERFIITDSRYFIQARMQCPDFELVDIKKGWKHIFSLIKESEIAFEENSLSYGMYSKITSQCTDKKFCAEGDAISMPRRVKDKHELELIAKAESIADSAFLDLISILKVGMTERQVAFQLEAYMKKQGASALSFPTIAASGVNSSMPHAVPTDKKIERGDFLTVDFGCVYEGYCSDMTRTVVFGTPSAKQSEVYSVVLKAQTEAVNALSCGMRCADADKIARDIIDDAGYADNFCHSLGHSLGIEVHETPSFSPNSKDILVSGNVMSVEPGIYIDGWGGVRIEDLIAVCDGQITNLTHSTKELIVI